MSTFALESVSSELWLSTIQLKRSREWEGRQFKKYGAVEASLERTLYINQVSNVSELSLLWLQSIEKKYAVSQRMSAPPAAAAAPSASSAAEILGWEGLDEIDKTLGLN